METIDSKGCVDSMTMDNVTLARMLTFITLAFHIIFATIGVGVPLMISIAEWLGIRKKDSHYSLLARRWARGYVVSVAVGVVTGNCIAFQLVFLWPGFMQIASKVIGLPLFMETFAFFFEAIFLGMYLYTWDRFKHPINHWLLSVPIVIGAACSGFFITSVNAFMNTPQGFQLENGVITKLDPWQAIFNPGTWPKVLHVLSSAYLTCAFVLAAIAAYHLFRGKKQEYYRKALAFTMAMSLIFSVMNVIVGDVSGKFLAQYQPEKLAAGEWHFHTESRAKLIVGGILDEHTMQIKYGLGVPFMLSVLAKGTPNAKVAGLDQFPRELWPPLYIHYFFDGMVGLGTYLFVISLVYFLLKIFFKGRDFKTLLGFIVLGGPLSVLAIEFGWIYAEVGRQPWILRGYMKTSEASTTSPHIAEILVLFSLLYLLLGIVISIVLIRLFKNKAPELELEQKKIIL